MKRFIIFFLLLTGCSSNNIEIKNPVNFSSHPLEKKLFDNVSKIIFTVYGIDNKFGEGTWTEILETRKKMIEEHNKQAKIQREMDKQHDKEVHDFWIKVWTWTWQLTVVVAVVITMWGWLSYASKGKLPFLW